MITKEYVSDLAVEIANGNKNRFEELVEIAKPLLVSLSYKFSKSHSKFEFEDFYSISLTALYRACLSYDKRNPSFLDYAKLFITRDLCREVQYWNAEMRDIFSVQSSSIEDIYSEYGYEIGFNPMEDIDHNIEIGQFRKNIDSMIDKYYDADHAEIVRMYLFGNYRISEIAKIKNMKYKKVYSFIVRSIAKIQNEYSKILMP